MVFDLKSEIVYLKINNGLLIANVGFPYLSICVPDSHHSSSLHKETLEMNSERNRFGANSNTSNAIYRTSKYEQCQGEEGCILSKYGEIK